ncbi:MAG: BrnT family toxin [Acidobacteria bacterium]|nr:BrnT family toxin [Acidobacteriota bacterium]
MKLVWDKDKAAHNLAKHGISFEEAQTVFEDDLFVVFADEDHSVEERRFVILGQSHKGRLLVVAYAERSRTTRIISARQATGQERKVYEEEI